jgi:hypothetical protein
VIIQRRSPNTRCAPIRVSKRHHSSKLSTLRLISMAIDDNPPPSEEQMIYAPFPHPIGG